MIKVLAHSDGRKACKYISLFFVKKERKNKVFFSEKKKFFDSSLWLDHFLTDYWHIKSDVYDFLIQIYAKRWGYFHGIFMQSGDGTHIFRSSQIGSSKKGSRMWWVVFHISSLTAEASWFL